MCFVFPGNVIYALLCLADLVALGLAVVADVIRLVVECQQAPDLPPPLPGSWEVLPSAAALMTANIINS